MSGIALSDILPRVGTEASGCAASFPWVQGALKGASGPGRAARDTAGCSGASGGAPHGLSGLPGGPGHLSKARVKHLPAAES